VSDGDELCFAILVTGIVWAAMSALVLAISIRVEAGWQAWGWGASFAVSSLCAAWCFGRLL
jgi:hypothetical protein